MDNYMDQHLQTETREILKLNEINHYQNKPQGGKRRYYQANKLLSVLGTIQPEYNVILRDQIASQQSPNTFEQNSQLFYQKPNVDEFYQDDDNFNKAQRQPSNQGQYQNRRYNQYDRNQAEGNGLKEQKSVQVNLNQDPQFQDQQNQLKEYESETILIPSFHNKATQCEEQELENVFTEQNIQNVSNKGIQNASTLSKYGENIVQSKKLIPGHENQKLLSHQTTQNNIENERKTPFQIQQKRFEPLRNSYQPSTMEELKMQRQYDKLYNTYQHNDFQTKVKLQKVQELQQNQKLQLQARDLEQKMRQERLQSQVRYRDQLSEQQKLNMELNIKQNQQNDVQVSYQQQKPSLFKQYEQKKGTALNNQILAKTKQRTKIFNPITFLQQDFSEYNSSQPQMSKIKSLGNIYHKEQVILPQFQELRLITPNRNYYKNGPYDHIYQEQDNDQIQQEQNEIQNLQQRLNQSSIKDEMHYLQQVPKHQAIYLKNLLEKKNNPFEPVLSGQYKVQELHPPANKEVKFTKGIFYPDTQNLLN